MMSLTTPWQVTRDEEGEGEMDDYQHPQSNFLSDTLSQNTLSSVLVLLTHFMDFRVHTASNNDKP